jgi:hypothetical protein
MSGIACDAATVSVAKRRCNAPAELDRRVGIEAGDRDPGELPAGRHRLYRKVLLSPTEVA